MFYAMLQIKRKPIPAVAIMLFAAILSMILCGLHEANEAEKRNYEEMYRTVPVYITATDITGTRATGLDARKWVYNIFTSAYEIGDYLTDICIKMSADIDGATLNGQSISCNKLTGITSLRADSSLFQHGDNVIKWNDGYDESVLCGQELVCILPDELVSEIADEKLSVVLSFSSVAYTEGQVSETWDYKCTLSVVGSHSLSGNVIYCPFDVVKTVYTRLDDPWHIDAISGTMSDNYKINEMWTAAEDWFVKPNPAGVKTPWDYSWYSYYPYALKVDDSQLVAAAETLGNSIQVNKICTLVVFTLSAAASFFIGLLIIRSRKREIALMRTMGTPNRTIYKSFAVEQMICAVLGTLLGGSYFLWKPIERLVAFVVIYFVGLSIALLIFLHTNLLTTIKEDE